MQMQGVEQARQVASTQVVHDARAVHDMADLKLADLSRGNRPWVVSRVRPAPQSGSATIPGASIRGDTGQFVSPPHSPPVVMKLGSLQVLSGSEPQTKSSETYSWTEPLDEEKRVLSPEDYYSPFMKGGVIINAAQPVSGMGHNLDAIYLTFDDWAPDVPEATAYLGQNPGDFQHGGLHAGTARLTRLLGSRNALLHLQAFRRLLQSKAIQFHEVEETIRAAPAEVAAVDTYLTLVDGLDGSVGERLANVVRAANSDVTRRGIAIGAHAVMLLSNDAAAIRQAAVVLAAARTALAGPLERDEYLKALFGTK